MTMTLETVEDNKSKLGILEGGRYHPGLGATPDVGPLAGCIYHDLRHPLTAILAYSELLEEDNLNRLQREDYHREIRLAVNRMNDLISLLLESSRGPAGTSSKIAWSTAACVGRWRARRQCWTSAACAPPANGTTSAAGVRRNRPNACTHIGQP